MTQVVTIEKSVIDEIFSDIEFLKKHISVLEKEFGIKKQQKSKPTTERQKENMI